MRTHTKEKPYKCNKCEYSAAQLTSLNTHTLINHPDDTMEVFQCNFCNYSTRVPQQIKYHNEKHTGEVYYCPHCPEGSRAWSHVTSLQGHIKRVHNKRPAETESDIQQSKKTKQVDDHPFDEEAPPVLIKKRNRKSPAKEQNKKTKTLDSTDDPNPSILTTKRSRELPTWKQNKKTKKKQVTEETNPLYAKKRPGNKQQQETQEAKRQKTQETTEDEIQKPLPEQSRNSQSSKKKKKDPGAPGGTGHPPGQ